MPMKQTNIVVAAILAWMLPALCLATDFSTIFKNNTDSVVTIKSGNNIGTGFYITPNLIVTNLHVIRSAPDISFATSYKDGFARVDAVAALDKTHDLALLYAKKPGKPVILARSADLVPGMELVSIGSPQGFEKTFAGGNFSQMRQGGLMQISIPVSPGSSGSPVFDAKGQVVGVVVAQRKEAQNLNFAIPSEFVLALLQKAEGIPEQEYMTTSAFHQANKDDRQSAGTGAVLKDYGNIDTGRDGCRNFSSTFFESPAAGPIKKCVCNDAVIYTNIICQCPACRK